MSTKLHTANVQRVVGSSNITRHTSYTYDSTTGELTAEITEPSLATTNPLRRELDYSYDAYGNRTSIAAKACVWVSSSSCVLNTRTSTVAYDVGPITRRSRHDHQPVSQSDSFAYDPAFGGPTAHTDANGLVQHWTYDPFGRVASATRADGNKTVIAYAYCTGLPSGEACPTNAQSDVIATPQNAGGTQDGPKTIAFYDALSRPLASDFQGFAGTTSWSRTATQYDALGRVSQTSRPYLLSAPPCPSSLPCWTTFTYDALGRVTQATRPDTSYNTVHLSRPHHGDDRARHPSRRRDL